MYFVITFSYTSLHEKKLLKNQINTIYIILKGISQMSLKIDKQEFKKSNSSKKLCYLKINFTESQFKVYEHKSKRINSFFSDNGFVFNEPEFFRVLALNFDNADFMKVMLSFYSADSSKLFRKDIKIESK